MSHLQNDFVESHRGRPCRVCVPGAGASLAAGSVWADFRRGFSPCGLGRDRMTGVGFQMASRRSCSTVVTTMPNIKWQNTLAGPRTRTNEPPQLSFKAELTRSAELR